MRPASANEQGVGMGLVEAFQGLQGYDLLLALLGLGMLGVSVLPRLLPR